ncbi:hypothetical protein R3P38DRAFT_343599 [Favolaschia claudopus]|uniref:Uncharacterized protein n=1 Tax=Favolaschia claudopus TaxID=2862362 RepID=A0AAV9ZJW0_9AGAR
MYRRRARSARCGVATASQSATSLKAPVKATNLMTAPFSAQRRTPADIGQHPDIHRATDLWNSEDPVDTQTRGKHQPILIDHLPHPRVGLATRPDFRAYLCLNHPIRDSILLPFHTRIPRRLHRFSTGEEKAIMFASRNCDDAVHLESKLEAFATQILSTMDCVTACHDFSNTTFSPEYIFSVIYFRFSGEGSRPFGANNSFFSFGFRSNKINMAHVRTRGN